MTEERVTAMIAEAQARMTDAIRLEFTSTQQVAEGRLGEVQQAMSSDIRKEFKDSQDQAIRRVEELQEKSINEFAKTNADFRTKLESFTTLIDKTLLDKFDAADKKFNEAIDFDRKAIAKAIDDLKAQWELVHAIDGLEITSATDFMKEGKEMLTNFYEMRTSYVSWAMPMLKHLETDYGGFQVQTREALRNHWDKIQQYVGNGPAQSSSSGGRPSKGLDIRVPDPRNWSLDVLNNGDREWYQWRHGQDLWT